MSGCIAQEEFQRLFAERLSAQERQVLEAHVDACAHCQQTLARLLDDSEEDSKRVDLQLLRLVRPSTTSDMAEEFLRYLQKNPPQPTPLPPGPSAQSEPGQIRFPNPPTERGPLGQLESYHIVAELGRGAFGFVFQAYDEQLDRLVAIKVLKPELAANAGDRTRFEREARAAATVRHDHIVTIHRVGSTPGFALPYFVMEYLDGETLSDRLEREGPLPPREAVELVRQVAQGLAAAHARGLVHRDIKPSNILLEKSSGRAKITDFGLARPVDVPTDKLTRSGDILGTLPYMSPEQIMSTDRIDPRSDVYSLGVVLYELLTGEVPFRGQKHLVLQQVVHEDPRAPGRLNDAVPRDLETICLKCLRKEPAKRYSGAAALAQDLARFLAGEPVLARPTRAWERGVKWTRRKPAVAALVAVSCTACILLVGGLTASNLFIARERDEARSQRRQAESNFRLAHDAVDRFYTQVSENVLLDEPGLQPLRKQLLQTAREFCLQFVAQRGEDAASRADLARVLWLLANIAGEIDSKPKAIELCRQALEIQEQVCRVHPNVAGYQHDLSKSYHNVGVFYFETGDLANAEAVYERARKVREKLVASYPEVSEYGHDLAKTHNNLGNIYRSTGKRDQAQAEHERAQKIWKDLTTRHPEMAEYQRHLAYSYANQALLCFDAGQVPQSEEFFRRALEIEAELVRLYPRVTRYQNELADTHNKLGILCGKQDRSRAETAYQQALQLRQKLAADNPDVTLYQSNLAKTYNSLGLFYSDARQTAEAENAFGLALQVQERLAREHPDVTKHPRDLAELHNNLGILFKLTGQVVKAEAAFRQALAIVEAQVRKHPELLEFTVMLGGICSNLGETLRDGGRPEAALPFYERGIRELGAIAASGKRHAQTSSFLRNARVGYALALARLGDHARATAVAGTVNPDEPMPGEVLQDLAAAYARAAGAVRDDMRLPRTDREKLADHYADRSLELLTKAHALGHFKEPANAEALQKNEDFSPLSVHQDFQRLLQDVVKNDGE